MYFQFQGPNYIAISGGTTFSEIGLISTATQVNCCNLSSDGKLLVTGGYDKKVRDVYLRLYESSYKTAFFV